MSITASLQPYALAILTTLLGSILVTLIITFTLAHSPTSGPGDCQNLPTLQALDQCRQHHYLQN